MAGEAGTRLNANRRVRACGGGSRGHFAYIEQDRNLETANRVARTIYEAVQSLRTLPHRGRARRIDTRELVLLRLPDLVVYRVHEDRVLVLNIVHGARRWP